MGLAGRTNAGTMVDCAPPVFPPPGPAPRVPVRLAMVAYTHYQTDARVRRQAEALAARGDEVVCFCLGPAGAGPALLEGVRVVELPLRRYRGRSAARYLLSYAAFLALSTVALLAEQLRRGLDIVHVHALPDFMVLAALPSRLLGARVILDIHDTAPETYAMKFGLPSGHLIVRLLRAVERMSSRLAHRTIAVHDVQGDLLVSRGIPAARLAVVMNSPDERLFPSRQAPKPASRPEEFRLFYHGTIARRHGLDLLVQAAAGLEGRIPGLRLTVCGEGDHLDELRRMAERLGVSHRVTFTGMLPLEEMACRLAAADLVVLPLRRDPATDLMLPVKALEAMACGVPVASAECRALRHYFGDDAVLFFRPDDQTAIESAIHLAFADKEAGRARARRASRLLEGCAWSREKRKYLALVDTLVPARPQGPASVGTPETQSESHHRIYPNVSIGPGAVIEDYVIIGRPPEGAAQGEHPTFIGQGAVIRSHTVIYAGTVIGDRFQTGHHVLVREHSTIGSDVSIGSGSILEHHVSVGNGVRIHSQAFVPETTVLEDECWIGPNVVITNAFHPLCPKAKECLKGARVGRRAKIGANATLLPDITLGHDSLVGAGSVVIGDVAPGVVVAGVPATERKKASELTCPYGLIERPYEIAMETMNADPAR